MLTQARVEQGTLTEEKGLCTVDLLIKVVCKKVHYTFNKKAAELNKYVQGGLLYCAVPFKRVPWVGYFK
jgi:hypothetical protein